MSKPDVRAKAMPGVDGAGSTDALGRCHEVFSFTKIPPSPVLSENPSSGLPGRAAAVLRCRSLFGRAISLALDRVLAGRGVVCSFALRFDGHA